MNDRERIIEAARLQRTLLRVTGLLVVMLAALVWSLRQSWDWVTFVAIPGTLLAALAVEVVNVALQAKARWSAVVIGLHLLLPVGMCALCLALGGIGLAAGSVPLMIAFDSAFVNGRVTRALAKAGVRVGFLGASEEELRRLATSACLHCGYNLTGLPTTQCPECGKESVLGKSACTRV